MKLLVRKIRWALVGFTLLYTAGLFFLTLLWHSSLAAFWPLTILHILAPFLFLPLIVLIPLAVFIRSWLLRGTVTLVCLLFLWMFVPSITPRLVHAASSQQLTVATFNTLYTNQQGDALINAIQSSRADLVGLQELSSAMAPLIEQQLRESYPYQLLTPSGGADGLGIISRYPFEVVSEAQAVPWQHVVVDVNGQPIDLLNIHFVPGHIATRPFPITGWMVSNYVTAHRDQQAAYAVQVIDAIPGPLIVLGDFNISDREWAYVQFEQRLYDAYRESAWGFGLTFPNHHAVSIGPLSVPQLIRIDYVWSGGGVTPLDARVECAPTGADHCMVIATLSTDVDGYAAN